MKTAKTIEELVNEAGRIATEKVDLKVPATALSLTSNGHSVLGVDNGDSFVVSDLAHQQLGSYLDIPHGYYNRLRANFPDLLDNNVNRLLKVKEDDRLVRTLDGNVRALLSSRYRILDNFDLLSEIVPFLMDVPGLSPVSCEITDTRLYLKLTTEALKGEVRKGDVIQMGIIFTNDEGGRGALAVKPYTVRLVCLNGAIHTNWGLRKHHTGARLTTGEDSYNVFSDETLKLADAAFFSQVRDVARNVLTPTVFEELLNTYRDAADTPMSRQPVRDVEVIANRFGLNASEEESVITHLMRSGDLTKWGAGNAITRTAEDVTSYERATTLEEVGGKVLTLARSEWREITRSTASTRPVETDEFGTGI